MKTKRVQNTQDLRAMLLDTIDGVRRGKIDPRQGQAISQLSHRVLQSARLDLYMSGLLNGGNSSVAKTKLNAPTTLLIGRK